MYRIAIDGPGGAGKSSVAKLIAKTKKIIYVDTGALYRAVGLYMVNNGIDIQDDDAVAAALPGVKLQLKFTDRQVLLLNGEDVGDKIRTPEMSMAASRVSAIPAVREFLLDTQRKIAKKNSVVMDGRDIGTVILPDAELKIFLVASPEARARRRYDELSAKGVETTYEAVLSEMMERDNNDSTRAVAPCVPAEDAILLDNSELTLEETAKAILHELDVALATQKTRRSYMRAYRILAPAVKFFLGVHATGLENIPKRGGLLVCCNHIAIRDVFVVACVFPRQLRFIAKKELFSVPVIGSLIRALGAVKLDRGGKDIGAIRTSVDLAKSGEAVSIFPQGHRYPGVNPATTQTKNGAALIAYHSGCDVLPVCIQVKGEKYGIFRRVNLHFGKVIPNSELGFKNGGHEEYKAATDRIFGEIVSLGGYGITNEEAK